MKSEILPENNFKYKLDFLKRFNALNYRGESLSHQKIFDRYNVWVFFQSRIFFNDLREFGGGKVVLEGKPPAFKIRIQDFVLSSFGILESLVAVVSTLVFKRKFMVYGVDRDNSKVFANDARMDPVYQYLRSSSKPFIEFMHTTFDLDLLKRFVRRKRFVFYIRAIDPLFYLLASLGLVRREPLRIEEMDLSAFDEREKVFVLNLLRKYLSKIGLIVFKVKVLRAVLPWIGAETLLAIDNTRDYWEMILACRMNGIKVYAFQHGHFTKYHVGWLNDGTFDGEIAHPDKLFVWSDFWKQELLRLGTYFPEDSIEVGGLKSAVNEGTERSKREDIGVLMPYEVDANKKEVKEYIDRMLSCGNMKIFFKLRTDIDSARQLDEYGLGEDYHPSLKVITDASKHIHEVDIIAGTYSTFLYDMVAFERPIVLLETSSDFGEGLVLNGLADPVHLGNICEKIKEIASTSKGVLIGRKEKLFGKSPVLMYHTIQRLCSKI